MCPLRACPTSNVNGLQGQGARENLMNKKWSKLLALLLVFGLIAAACGDSGGDETTATTAGSSDTTAAATTAPPTTISPDVTSTTVSETGPVYGGRVTVGLEAEAEGLRPWEDGCSAPCRNMMVSIYDKLFEIDSNFEPMAWLATDITPNDDFTEWVMNVREGVVFHNGAEFNAQTVADMFPIQLEGSISAGIVASASLADVQATGPFEVTYTLASGNSAFPAFLTARGLGTVFDPALAASDSDGYAQNPVGTGPFVMANRDIDNETLMVRNESYWMTDEQGNSLPYLDEIAWRPIPDEGTRLSSLISGTVNAMQSLRQGTIRDARDASGITLFEFQGNNSGGGMYNVLVPPYDDVRVRKGLTQMNNQDAVIAALGGTGISLPGTQWFSPDSPWYSEDVAAAWPKFDVAAGTALIQEYIDDPARSDGKAAGESIDVELSCPPDPTLIAAMQVIEAVWTSTGLINVTLTQFDQATHINNALGRENGFVGTHRAHCWRWAADDDPSTFLNNEFAAPTPEIAEATGIPFSPVNFSNYFDPEMFGWLVAAIQTDDFQQRYDLYEMVMMKFAEDVPVWYSGHTATVIAVSEGITGVSGWVNPEGVLGAGVPGAEGRWHFVQITDG